MRRFGWLGALTIATITCVEGCGGGGGNAAQASCTLSESTPGVSLMLCEEIQSISPQDIENLRQSCGMLNVPDAGVQAAARFMYGPCSRVDAIGGCQIGAGSVAVTQWYYDDGTGALTPADVQMACTAGGGVFVQA